MIEKNKMYCKKDDKIIECEKKARSELLLRTDASMCGFVRTKIVSPMANPNFSRVGLPIIVLPAEVSCTSSYKPPASNSLRTKLRNGKKQTVRQKSFVLHKAYTPSN